MVEAFGHEGMGKGMKWLFSILAPWWPRIAAWGIAGLSVLVTILGLFYGGSRRGRQEAEAEANETTLEAVKEGHEIENRVVSLDDVERKRLRAKWTKRP